ncbi:MAG TPA: DinB family protein [Roseiflexaceae bacterium]|nr:DinB family protein [Roseiflexaceae bacterium]HMP38857.1 DinB family protein [Roseiflexaceae bacterium]
MTTDDLRLLFDYHYWANHRLLRAAEGIGAADLTAPYPFPCRSLRGTLVHTMSAEWIWRSRWQGTAPAAMLDEQEFASIEAIRTRWAAEEALMRAFIAGLRDEDLQRHVEYSNTRGVIQPLMPLWQLMTHCVNHGTQHRSEAAAILTELGRSPGDLDLILFLRERAV